MDAANPRVAPAPDRLAEVRPVVIFLHIGKTAGSTLRTVIHRNYPARQVFLIRSDPQPGSARPRREHTVRDFARLPEEVRARPRVFEGHIIFGIHEHVPHPSTYITILRDPERLAVSQYNYVRRRRDHRLHELVAGSGMSLARFVSSGASLEIDNGQTRAIAGDTATPFGEVSETMLQVAVRNMDERFSVVGLTERFDESLLLMGRLFVWTRLGYVPAKVSPARDRDRGLSEEVAHAIAEHSEFDRRLYQHAARRLEEQIAGYPSFTADLERFRRSNARYRTWGNLTRGIPRRLYARLAGKE